jgi:CheY-like chemotaxis protein
MASAASSLGKLVPEPAKEVRVPRVLLADDGRETLALLHGVLQYEGIDVIGVAANGFEAVDMADRLLPDVVLMDLRMPELDGFGATLLIKQNRPWIQVVFLTFYDELLPKESPQELGAFAYLLKGCSPGLMKDVIYQAATHAWEERWESRPEREGSRQ